MVQGRLDGYLCGKLLEFRASPECKEDGAGLRIEGADVGDAVGFLFSTRLFVAPYDTPLVVLNGTAAYETCLAVALACQAAKVEDLPIVADEGAVRYPVVQ